MMLFLSFSREKKEGFCMYPGEDGRWISWLASDWHGRYYEFGIGMSWRGDGKERSWTIYLIPCVNVEDLVGERGRGK